MPRTTNERTYAALQHVNGVIAGGEMRGNLNVQQLRNAVRALAGMNLVLVQHVQATSSTHTDALDAALLAAEQLLTDLEVDPGPGQP